MLFYILLAVAIGGLIGGLMKGISAGLAKNQEKASDPSAQNAEQKDPNTPGPNEWKCPACGKINQNYVGTCGCGQVKTTPPVATARPAAQPQPTVSPTPAVRPAEKVVFACYTGSGVCDVCNRPLSGEKAWIVPNRVFYASPEYRRKLKSQITAMTGRPVSEADIDMITARDTSSGSAVCEHCIGMFDGTPQP